MQPTSEIMNITPELAREMLKHNNSNFRPLDPHRVLRYSREMTSGNWTLNGQGIVFDKTGELVDGQTRLAAIVKSGRTIQMLVVRGVGDVSMTVDRGKPRIISQWLRHKGMKHANQMAAVARLAIAHNKGLWKNKSFKSYDIIDSEIVEFCERHEKELYAAINMGNKSQDILIGSIAAAVYFLGSNGLPSSSENAKWFAKKLQSGDGLSLEEPVYHFREWLRSFNRDIKPSANVVRWTMTNAWNMTILGKTSTTKRAIVLTLTGPRAQTPPNEVIVEDSM